MREDHAVTEQKFDVTMLNLDGGRDHQPRNTRNAAEKGKKKKKK